MVTLNPQAKHPDLADSFRDEIETCQDEETAREQHKALAASSPLMQL